MDLLDELYPEIPIRSTIRIHSPAGGGVALRPDHRREGQPSQVTPALFEVAPDPERMADLDVETIRGLIREVGLAPTKAKHLKGMARMLLDDHDGMVPSDLEALERLPGVGHKTASVVVAQAFGIPAFPVDTHIHHSPLDGGCRMARTSYVPNGTSSGPSPSHDGMTFTCRSSCSAVSIVQHGGMIYRHAPSAGEESRPRSASPRKRDDGDQRLNRLVARAMIVPVDKDVIPAIQMSWMVCPMTLIV